MIGGWVLLLVALGYLGVLFAIAWYGDRLSPDYRPATVEHLQGLLTTAGLTDPFWRLPG